MASCVGTSPLYLPVGIGNFPHAHVKLTRPNIVGMKPLPYNIRKGELKIATLQNPSSHVRHAAALPGIGLEDVKILRKENFKCAAATASATQTVTRNSRSMTTDKVKSPKLDNNGPGLPPYDGDGHGGNGGGGGNFSGGLILLGILGVLDVLKDIEKQWQRKHNR
ncbi:hypothetical protein JHK82_027692 [Glycine max]|uniref:Uncharacterized protein n=2 Tax=Glycine subgen. Soja TaxID=1462606 RepID=K7LIG6_SOYBN|nr:uncharacterized protein LOC100781669 isoform X1 [Glycine max]XP_006588945.1 uncharacterized protein LOC100781669 isoform X1 [Glycine max]XP_006588947.1 uncharacterized protein LOC100781669 isoform X1 [Glycine max]XP_014618021.1 uncharacterized protein LOC100781669 isoform X1 [Glycine max]XP_028182406.1 protein FERTILITY RESTORER RF2, mitochondrial-like isoform X1 [Glycine soja]XP_028182407.1 protein FERTILITY RESTORER RF2, mitochondrial-like isoform X1 [Glycine soja]XP_028182408.1 protein |eukprot:XP_003535880.1 uncharacterized protein LOC100781669 isoform X1 [Glycine max]